MAASFASALFHDVPICYNAFTKLSGYDSLYLVIARLFAILSFRLEGINGVQICNGRADAGVGI